MVGVWQGINVPRTQSRGRKYDPEMRLQREVSSGLYPRKAGVGQAMVGSQAENGPNHSWPKEVLPLDVVIFAL